MILVISTKHIMKTACDHLALAQWYKSLYEDRLLASWKS